MTSNALHRLVALLAITGSLALAQAASATDYCVDTTCGGQDVATFQDALNLAAAAGNSDRIFLGAQEYAAPAGGFKYQMGGYPVEIIGAGVGNTVLTAPAGASGYVLVVTANGSIHDLTVKIPANAANGFDALHTASVVERVDVTEAATQTNMRRGVTLDNGGELRDSTVTIADDGSNSTGVSTSGTAKIWGSTISAETAVNARDFTTVGNSRLSGNTGIAVYSGAITVTHTLIHGSGPGWTGIYAGNQSIADTTVDADGVVITGAGAGTTRGIIASASLNPDRSVGVTLRNSVIRDAAQSLFAYAQGPAAATVAVSYSDLPPTDQAMGAFGQIVKSNVTNHGNAAGFVDAAAGDFHLAPGSPLIDAGDPASPAADFDLDGNPADLDGDGDGVVRRDVGAFEAPAKPVQPVEQGGGSSAGDTTVPATPADTPASESTAPVPAAVADTQAPVLSGLVMTSRAFRIARSATATSFRFALSERATVTLRIQRAVVVRGHKRWRTVGTITRAGVAGKNSVRFNGRIGKRVLQPGSYRALVRAADAAGNRSATKQARFAVLGR